MQQKKHIITISGRPGSGKSSTAQQLSKLLGYNLFYSGAVVREIAKRRGLTIGQLNKIAEKDETIDHEIDKEIMKYDDEDQYIVDARLGFHWIPDSFKVFLYLDMDVAAARIFHDIDSRMKSAEYAIDVGEVENGIRERMESERKRYEKLYGINPYHPSHFDLVIDTAQNNPMSVALKIFDEYKLWLRTDKWKQKIERASVGQSLQ